MARTRPAGAPAPGPAYTSSIFTTTALAPASRASILCRHIPLGMPTEPRTTLATGKGCYLFFIFSFFFVFFGLNFDDNAGLGGLSGQSPRPSFCVGGAAKFCYTPMYYKMTITLQLNYNHVTIRLHLNYNCVTIFALLHLFITTARYISCAARRHT